MFRHILASFFIVFILPFFKFLYECVVCRSLPATSQAEQCNAYLLHFTTSTSSRKVESFPFLSVFWAFNKFQESLTPCIGMVAMAPKKTNKLPLTEPKLQKNDCRHYRPRQQKIPTTRDLHKFQVAKEDGFPFANSMLPKIWICHLMKSLHLNNFIGVS